MKNFRTDTWKYLGWVMVTLALGTAATKATAQEEQSQTTAPLISDRPDFTESPQTVPVGRIQIEAGISRLHHDGDRETSYGETLVRIAAGTRAEVRIGVPSYLVDRNFRRATGEDDAFLGAKFVLGARKIPLALLVGTTLPTGSRRVAEHRFQPEAVLATEISLSKTIDLDLNLGCARPTNEEKRFSQIFGSASLGFDLSPRVGAFAELYALNRTEADGHSQKFADVGLTYLLNPNLQLDARVGVGIANHVSGPDDFYGVGVTKRF